MKKVMKYEFKDVHVENLTLPVGAIVLGVAAVYGVPAVFALIDDDQKEEEVRTFHRVRTGMPVKDVDFESCNYLGTYLVESFGTTWSVFEDRKKGLKTKTVHAKDITVGKADARVVSVGSPNGSAPAVNDTAIE